MPAYTFAKIDIEKCIKCTACIHECEHDAITEYDEVIVISYSKCSPYCTSGCQQGCRITCPVEAIEIIH